MSASRHAILLLGRGGLGSAAKNELQALREQCQQQAGAAPVALAFVDRAQPALPEALDALLAAQPQGLERITIQPVFVPDEPALRRWLEKLAMRWLAQQLPAERPRLIFAEPLGSAPQLAELLLAQVQAAAPLPDVAQSQTGEDWQTDPLAWSDVPEHRRHVLWCTGPRCAAKGSVALWPLLQKSVQADPLLKKNTELLQTSCQYPCNHGPLMIVYPEGRWYGRLDADSVSAVLRSHLEGGALAQTHCVHRLGQGDRGDAGD